MVPPPTHSVSTLRAYLLNALSNLPGHRIFDIHVLVSTQRKPNESLFPYLSPKPRSFMQEVLILLSERAPATNSTESALSPAVFVTAIEADVFYFPASVSTILYISKVDGTGQGTYPSPTSTLVNALLQFYGSPTSPIYPTNLNHTLWVHLFARAQRQYLFPNSADYPDKKPLGDVALCKWWKKSLGQATLDILKAREMVDPFHKERINLSANLFYIIPGQSEAEATYSLGLGGSSTEPEWIYSHPYDVHKKLDIPLASASPGSEGKEHSLPSLIPYFDDDPKSRFLDELAATSEERTVAVPMPTPKRKKRKLSSSGSQNNIPVKISAQGSPKPTFIPQSPGIRMPQPEPLRHGHPLIALIPPSSSPPRIDDEEPIERPSTPEPNLEEQVLETPQTPHMPRLTTSLLSPHTPQNSTSRESTSNAQLTSRSKVQKSPHTPKSSRRPLSDLDKVTPAEFWERMSFRQECAQGAVTGFFVVVFAQKYLSNGKEADIPDTGPSILMNGTVPHVMIKRIMTSLLTGVEFSSMERSHKATQVIETSIKGLCDGLRDTSSETPLAPEDESGIYSRHVHATLTVNNPPIFRKQTYPSTANEPPVNILGVRRKKKRD